MFTHNIDFNILQVINFTEDISHQCAAGVAYETPCYKGLAYNPEIHVCDYPDSVRCLRCFQTLLFFHLSRAPEEPFSLQHSASRCRTVRNNLRGSLGSSALRWLWYCFFFVLTKLFTISECFSWIYPSQRQNLLPTLEIITHYFQNFQKIQNFGKNSKI